MNKIDRLDIKNFNENDLEIVSDNIRKLFSISIDMLLYNIEFESWYEKRIQECMAKKHSWVIVFLLKKMLSVIWLKNLSNLDEVNSQALKSKIDAFIRMQIYEVEIDVWLWENNKLLLKWDFDKWVLSYKEEASKWFKYIIERLR